MSVERTNPEGLHVPPGYHHVTIVDGGGRVAYLAGQCPVAIDGTVVRAADESADLDAQVEQIVANSLVALRAVDAAPDDVVRSVIYVVTAETPTLVPCGGASRSPRSRPRSRPRARCSV